jgi:hypothetical protein
MGANLIDAGGFWSGCRHTINYICPWDHDSVAAPPGCTIELADFKTKSTGNRQRRWLIGSHNGLSNVGFA